MGFFKRLFGLESRPILPPQAPPSFTYNYTEEELVQAPVKRGRGRPPKNQSDVRGLPVKRGRGRPRKTEAGGTQVKAPVARAAAKKPKARKKVKNTP